MPSVAERELAVTLPGTVGPQFRLRCWTKNDRVLLDEAATPQLSQTVESRWQALEEGRSILPQKGPILTEVRVVRPTRKLWISRLVIRVQSEEADRNPIEHTIDGRGGFFDITDAGLV